MKSSHLKLAWFVASMASMGLCMYFIAYHDGSETNSWSNGTLRWVGMVMLCSIASGLMALVAMLDDLADMVD